ncbi:MAG: hypothetical protein MPN21_24960 [Thermoanaerobaculia bacterium]|nr:hypothetical protein [Thermoanaerobaculia bacterium]
MTLARRVEALYEQFPDDPPHVLLNAMIEAGAEDRVARVVAALDTIRAHEVGRNEVALIRLTYDLLTNRQVAARFAAEPTKTSNAIRRIRTLSGFGAHNTFHSLGQLEIGRAFAESPSVFVRLAERLGEECIGGFPALKCTQVLAWFRRDPNGLTAAFGRLVDALGTGAGSVLNELHTEPLGPAFCEHSETFLEVVVELQNDLEPHQYIGSALRDPQAAAALTEYLGGNKEKSELQSAISVAL